MTDGYRLTFNKPAVAQLLHTDDGEQADGLKVRIEDGKVSFLPVHGSKEGDVLRIETRSRGGVEAAVEGTMADDLIRALANDDGPFSILHRQAGGWLAPTPHPSGEAPSKFVPHVRVWQSGVVRPKRAKAAKATRRKTGKQESGLNIVQMFDQLIQARQTVVAFDRDKRRGQPPRAVREAREALSAFESMVTDFLPEISEAHSILGKIVTRAEPRRRKNADAIAA